MSFAFHLQFALKVVRTVKKVIIHACSKLITHILIPENPGRKVTNEIWQIKIRAFIRISLSNIEKF